MKHIPSRVEVPQAIADAQTTRERQTAIEDAEWRGQRAQVALATVSVSLGGDGPTMKIEVPVAVLSHPDIPMRELDDADLRLAGALALDEAVETVREALRLG